MQLTTKHVIGAALLASVAAPAVSLAAGGGFVGLGAGMVPDYEGSDDYEAIPVLFGRYQWDGGRYVDLGGAPSTGSAVRLSANLLPKNSEPTWTLGPLLQYRMKRDDVDNNKVDEMQQVDATVEAGAFVGLKNGPWEANLSFAGDVGSEYDGYLVYLSGAYNRKINDKLSLKFGARTTYADDNYMDTYFGVSGSDAARSGLKKYSADGGMKDWGLNVTANYAINDSWGVTGILSYSRLLGDAEDSPLVSDVGNENQYGATLALTYKF